MVLGFYWSRNALFESISAKCIYSYVMGFFVMLALFELVFFPAAMLNLTLTSAAVIYSILILLSAGGALWVCKPWNLRNFIVRKPCTAPNRWEYFYFVLFLILLMIQLYYAVFYSRTYMADDGYVVFSTSALATDFIFLGHPYTGLYQVHDYRWLYRVIQTFNYFPAYLSWVSRVHPTIIAHTVLYVEVTLLAYGTYYVMAHQLFRTNENRYMFLCFTATLFIYGYHSHYSLTFRLLGPNNEGKAVLAVVLAPFMMIIMQDILKLGYRKTYGIQLMILSIAACSLTMGGIYTMAAILIVCVFFAICKSRSLQPVRYLLWGGSIPCLFSGLYLISRFAII